MRSWWRSERLFRFGVHTPKLCAGSARPVFVVRLDEQEARQCQTRSGFTLAAIVPAFLANILSNRTGWILPRSARPNVKVPSAAAANGRKRQDNFARFRPLVHKKKVYRKIFADCGFSRATSSAKCAARVRRSVIGVASSTPSIRPSIPSANSKAAGKPASFHFRVSSRQEGPGMAFSALVLPRRVKSRLERSEERLRDPGRPPSIRRERGKALGRRLLRPFRPASFFPGIEIAGFVDVVHGAGLRPDDF